MKFEVGTIVQLASGGPLMTVIGISDEGGVLCQWFLKGNPVRETFPDQALKEHEEQESVDLDDDY